ncbi:arginase family protein [Modestobacter sp. NPDC049651]|uniref:arginase family protein n=1 Tax=unclassified Modestobacter TaxID=2643866 RepID=UPI0033D66B3C
MTAAVHLLVAPWDSGVRGTRMGGGPPALARAGADRLRARGRPVTRTDVEPAAGWAAELRTAFELQRATAAAAARAHGRGELPVLLSGDCNTTVGMLAALQSGGARVGLFWLDAHGDLNTPDVDARGYLDGHGLAMAVGWCWRAATATVPGFAPLPEEHVVLVGARDLDPAERTALAGSGIRWLPPDRARDPVAVDDAVRALAGAVDVVHLHVDLDVLDPSIAPANGYAAPGGLTGAEVQEVVRQTAGRVRIGSATLASWDPSYDPAGRLRDTAVDLLETVCALAG